jgi:hypothetical protein
VRFSPLRGAPHYGPGRQTLDGIASDWCCTPPKRRDRPRSERALANWANRAETLDQEAWGLEREVYVDRHEREQWFDRHGDELIELAAAKLELHHRDEQARERRINDIRRDPPTG